MSVLVFVVENASRIVLVQRMVLRRAVRLIASKPSFISRLMVTTALVAAPTVVFADNFVWDSSQNGSSLGGTGDWDANGGAPNFRPNNGADANTSWVDGNTAIFGTSSGNVAVKGHVTIGGLVFAADGYVLSGNVNGSLNLANGTTVDAVVQSAGHTATISAPIVGAGGLRTSGAGTLNLTGANTFTGAFAQTAGTTTLSAGSIATDTLSISGGIFNLSRVDSVANGATITVSDSGQLNVNANDTINSLRMTGAMAATTIANGFTLSAIGTDAAGTSLLNAGTIGGAGTFGVGQGAFVQNGGTLSVSNVNVALYALTGGEIAASTTLQTTGNDVDLRAGTINGVIAGARGVAKSGTGLAVMNGVNTYTGMTTVTDGTLQVTAFGALPTGGDVVVNGGLLDVNFRQRLNSLTGSGGQVDIASNHSLRLDTNSSGSFAGSLTGAGSLEKNGNGTLTLSGANTLASMALNAGAISLTGGQAFGDQSLLTMGPGTTLNVLTSETMGALEGPGNVVLSAGAILSTGADNSDRVIDGVISGQGGLTKVGTGLLTLNGANTYLGNTTVEAGTLRLGSFERLANTSNVVVNGGTLDLSPNGDETIATLSGTGGIVNVRDGMSRLRVGDKGTDFTYAGQITGQGGLLKAETGTFTLTGANDYMGPTAIAGGAISVRGGGQLGSVNSPLTILNDARLLLSGPLSVGTTMLNNTSSIDMSGNNSVADRMTINGNLTMAAGTSLAVNVDANQASDKLTVNGMVNLDGTLNVVATGTEGSYVIPEFVYTIIENDGVDAVVGAFTNLVTNFAFLTPTVTTTGGDGNDVVVTLLNANSVPSTTPTTLDFKPFAQGLNQASTASALDQFDYSSSDGADIRQNLIGLTTGQATQALNQIGGQGHGAGQAFGDQTGGQFLSTVMGQIQGGSFGTAAAAQKFAFTATDMDGDVRDLFNAFGVSRSTEAPLFINPRNSVASQDMLGVDEVAPTVAGWTQVFGQYSQIDGNVSNPELTNRTWGVAIGTEVRGLMDDPAVMLGVSGGFSHATFSTGGTTTSQSDNYHVGVYGGWGAINAYQEGFGLTGALGYTFHKFESDRNIAFGGLTRTASADYDGHSFGGEIRVRYGMPTEIGDHRVVVAPIIGAQASHFEAESFTETGAGSLNLTSSRATTNGMSTLLGGELSSHLEGEELSFSPRVSALWKHKFGDVNSNRGYTLNGSPTSFTSLSPEVDRDSMLLGAGADIDFSNEISLSLDTGADIARDSSSYFVGARVLFKF